MKIISSIKDIPEQVLTVGGGPLCAGCPGDIGLKIALQALGKNTIVVNASGCMTLYVTFPHMTTMTPWIHLAIENAGAGASGILAALRQMKKKATVLCYAGDGATYDIGFQSLSGAAERGEDFVYICYNNQSFSNTGVQMSSATPVGTYTTTTPDGNPILRKSMVKIMAAHNIPYTATASISYPMDYIKKVQKAASVKGPAFIDLIAPCPTGWGFDHSNTIEMGKLAVQTGAWPLYEVEKGKFQLTFSPAKLLPIEKYMEGQRRFSHLNKKDMDKIQELINKEWDLLKQGRFWDVVEF